MFSKKSAAALAALFVLTACCACTPGGEPVDPDPPKIDAEFKAEDYAHLPVIPFSSMQAVESDGESGKFKMQARWSDTYHVTISSKVLQNIVIFDESGKTLVSSEEDFDIALTEGQVVYVSATPVKTNVRFTVKGKENSQPLPFDIGEAPDPASFATTSADPAVDPLQAATINYVKRKNTKYVYSNAPETLRPECVNQCITRQDVSNESVYFTFEHQCREVGPVYYGYRVTNTGTEDMYVTVKNIGYQRDGKGAYLGEKEWIDFYRTAFPLPDLSDLNDSQKELYKGFYDFSGQYFVTEYQPTTYRIPAGKYMYALGGTTVDSFDGINVAKTADNKTNNAVVENGAVLFDVVGQAEGAFFIYNDIAAVAPGTPGGESHMGGTIQPDASCGWDEGYVIDNQATWIFNDATPAQPLPVTYTNYYADNVGTNRIGANAPMGTPNTWIEGTEAHVQYNNYWATHLDVQQAHDAVGTDVALFHTVDQQGNPIVYGCNYWDSEGRLPNMGSWMKDYQDVFTFVNQGDQPRTVRINIRPNGGMPVMMRSMDGKRIMDKGLAPFYALNHNTDYIGNSLKEGFDKACHYEVVIPAHTVKQFVVEYNLMANSNGYMHHSVDLI